MNILALDLSLTRTGWARNYGDPREGVLVPPKGRDRGVVRLEWFFNEVTGLTQHDVFVRPAPCDLAVLVLIFAFSGSGGVSCLRGS